MAPAFAQKQPVTLEAVEEIGRRPAAGPGNPTAWAADGRHFVYRDGRKLMLYDLAARSAHELVDTSAFDSAAEKASGPPKPFEWENRGVTERNVQFASSGNEILYAQGGDLFLIHVETGKWDQLTKTPAAEHDPKLSPDGSRAAFRREWDLYVIDLKTRKETRITTGGSETLRNGAVDWVYPEELSLGTAYWWSPDSRSILYMQFDTSHEPVYPHGDFRGSKAVFEPQRYPQVGDPNPDVRLGVAPAGGGKTKWFDLGDTREKYLISRAGWFPDSKSLYAVRNNRIQNRLEMLAIAIDSGKVSTLIEESDPYWLNYQDDPRFVNGGKQFLWRSERDGFDHLYLYGVDGKLVRQLTSGNWAVTATAGVDAGAGRVYYTSSEPSPTERQLYSIGLDGTGKRTLSTGAGTHTINMAPNASYYLDTFSSLTSPPRTTLHDASGRELGVYREADRRILDDYVILPTEISTFRTPEGTVFYARLIKPAGFDPSKKYPAIVQVYGGPRAQSVRNAWPGLTTDQVYAQRGFVIWQVDNRGSAGYGHAFEIPVFHKLGVTELADQRAGVEHLVSMGFVDRTRVGIQGWSYGGFMTLNALLNAPDVFRAGIAGAPVTDFRNYDTIYTERYMGLLSENSAGYQNTALVSKAKNLAGKLMIAHNLEDDNVLFQNSMQMIQALEQAGKQFELMIYPQKTHGVTGPLAAQMNASMLNFFERTLKASATAP